jgi:hypothetical protein
MLAEVNESCFISYAGFIYAFVAAITPLASHASEGPVERDLQIIASDISACHPMGGPVARLWLL